MPMPRDLEKSRAIQMEWYRKNRERVIAGKRKKYAENPDANKDYYLRKTFGIGLQDKRAMFESQGNVCAACGSKEYNGGRDWHVDHDHVTGKIRGILCRPCNVALGLLGDQLDEVRRRATALIEYLERDAAAP